MKTKKSDVYFDTEIYPNYFCAAFGSADLSVHQIFEYPLDVERILAIFRRRMIVGFNTLKFDYPILSLALNGYPISTLYEATVRIIERGEKPWEVLRDYDVELILPRDHVDLLPLVPPKTSLKLVAARLGAISLQDLPIAPGTVLAGEQKIVVRNYCKNDLHLTKVVHDNLREAIALRDLLGEGLRSKSDAQVAEAIISRAVERETGVRPQRPEDTHRRFNYKRADFIKFRSAKLNALVDEIERIRFSEDVVKNYDEENPSIVLPKVEIAGRSYQMGVGGLHSTESAQALRKPLRDLDVTSYYPSLMLLMGFRYEAVYDSKIVTPRINAKKAGDKTKADALKIAANGTFGKCGNHYSFLFDPEFMVRTTISGQLSLLMFIEMLTDAGCEVVSANTDGVVVVENPKIDAIAKQWEKQTGLALEEAHYKALFSRDVNNYVAIKTDGSVKVKGVFAEPGLKKNPNAYICAQAAVAYLSKGTAVEKTISACEHIEPFLFVRTVKGGAEYIERSPSKLPSDPDKRMKHKLLIDNGWRCTTEGRKTRYDYPAEFNPHYDMTLGKAYDLLIKIEETRNTTKRVYLGRVARWYWSNSTQYGQISYKSNGKLVGNSSGCRPAMVLSAEPTVDIDEARYAREAIELIESTGAKYL